MHFTGTEDRFFRVEAHIILAKSVLSISILLKQYIVDLTLFFLIVVPALACVIHTSFVYFTHYNMSHYTYCDKFTQQYLNRI